MTFATTAIKQLPPVENYCTFTSLLRNYRFNLEMKYSHDTDRAQSGLKLLLNVLIFII